MAGASSACDWFWLLGLFSSHGIGIAPAGSRDRFHRTKSAERFHNVRHPRNIGIILALDRKETWRLKKNDYLRLQSNKRWLNGSRTLYTMQYVLQYKVAEKCHQPYELMVVEVKQFEAHVAGISKFGVITS